MAVATQAELIRVLGSGDYDAILDTRESEWLDFKSQAYDLDSPSKGADLAADIAAFANAGGGCILLGVHEAALPDSQEKVASKTRGVPATSVNDERVRAHVRAHVHPLAHIDIRRFPIDVLELILIEVRPLESHDRPAIVDRITPLEGQKAPAHAIGWPTRHSADTHWTPAARIQQLISDGLRPDGGDFIAHSGGLPPADPAADHLDLLDQEDGWEDWPRLIVQAIPDTPASPVIADFYGTFADQVRQWRGIRPMGFGLGLDYAIEQRGMNLIRGGDRRFVAIDRAGTFTAAANGTPEMLGWSNTSVPWDQITEVTINPVVLVEYFAEAARFVDEFLMPAVNARRWRLKVIGLGLQQPRKLVLDTALRTMFPSHKHEPTVDKFTSGADPTGEPARDAYTIVSEIVGPGWGVPGRDLPFIVDGRVDVTLIGQK